MAMGLRGNNDRGEDSFDMAEAKRLANEELDDDGHTKRTGTLVTASAHIITAVIGSGVLSLSWARAQLGWVIGFLVLVSFSFITWYCSTLQADCYISPNPVNGKRNYTYLEAVKTNLGLLKMLFFSHKNGHNVPCDVSLNVYLIIFASIEIVLSQIPNFHKIWWLSIMAAVMSFSYSLIGLGLSIAKLAEGNNNVRTSLTGEPVGVDLSRSDKVWKMLQSLGNVVSAFSFALILIEIQDTLKSNPPANKVMKKTSLIGVSTTTGFYMLCGVIGYVAFGNAAPGNFLTGFGFYDPFWLIDIGNICIVIHLLGAYQVVLTAVVAMTFPFLNSFVGFVGGVAFLPLTVYFPVEMYISQAKVRRFSGMWIWLKVMSLVCLVVSLAAACGSLQGLIHDLRECKPFKNF